MIQMWIWSDDEKYNEQKCDAGKKNVRKKRDY